MKIKEQVRIRNTPTRHSTRQLIAAFMMVRVRLRVGLRVGRRVCPPCLAFMMVRARLRVGLRRLMSGLGMHEGCVGKYKTWTSTACGPVQDVGK